MGQMCVEWRRLANVDKVTNGDRAVIRLIDRRAGGEVCLALCCSASCFNLLCVQVRCQREYATYRR